MLQFDEWGYITPPEVHYLALENFERIFVIDPGRDRLYRRLLNFVADLKSLGTADLYIWIGGSFVTEKQIHGDIDVVFFIENQIFDKNEKRLFEIRNYYEPDIDAFYVMNFPATHPDYPQTVHDRSRWFEFWKIDRQENFKGLIEIKL